MLQYEVKMEEPLTCGGAYLKLFDASVAGVAEGEVSQSVYMSVYSIQPVRSPPPRKMCP